MTAGGGDFERALSAFLSLDVGEIERHAGDLAHFRLRAREHLRAAKMIGKLNERGRSDDFHFRARPGGFRTAERRADQPFAAGVRADGGGKDAGDGRDRAVEAELAQHGESGERVMRDGADRGHQAERDRQIVMASFLRQVGGRQIDGDAAGGEREARGDQRGADPFTRFRNRLVCQSYHMESGQPRRDLHLDVDGARFDALERHGRYALDHFSAPAWSEILAEANIVWRYYRSRTHPPYEVRDWSTHGFTWRLLNSTAAHASPWLCSVMRGGFTPPHERRQRLHLTCAPH